MRTAIRWISTRWTRIAVAALVLHALAAAPSRADAPPATVVSFAGLPGYTLVTVAPRAEGSQKFLMIDVKDAKATVILFAGGSGFVNLNPLGIGSNLAANFLLRTRDFYLARRLRVAIVDAPSDAASLGAYRIAAEHAADIGAVVGYLHHRYRDPVWLVGTSAGSVSAANAASNLTGHDGADGLVLSSSLLGAPGFDVFTFNLAAISIPTLVVHHELDGCAFTAFADVPALMAALTDAEDLQLQTYTGGGPLISGPCDAFHYHGYIGIEGQVVGDIADYILSHRHRHGGHGRGHGH